MPELLAWVQLGLTLDPHKIKGVAVDRRFVVDEWTPTGAAVQRLRKRRSAA